MGERRHSFAVTMVVVLAMLVVSTEVVYAKLFYVGRNDGICLQDVCWANGITDWPKNKTIKAGDILVFNYDFNTRDVTVVDEEGYRTCNPGKNRIVYRTGHDYIQVPEGPSYYICSINRLCEKGTKIAIIPA
ncbi:Cupredoxin [Vigna unguiculata]|uniref:Cupredoxin n=1 Tax=Vigna unguiculata TaxID=3917 RepID=A0A4D6M5F3_VIGUN|nr:Cupredoxin [Vigna unguiculata]